MTNIAERIDNNSITRLANIVGNLTESVINNAQDSASTAPIRPVSFSKEIYEKAYMNSPLLDFLREKGRIVPTDSDANAYPVEDISEQNRAKRGNETASDITGTDVDWKAPVYETATFGKKISVTDKSQFGTPTRDLIGIARANAFIDIQSAVDEALFNAPGNDKQFDGIYNTTTNVEDKAGDMVTVKDVDKLIVRTMDYGAKVDVVVATAEAARQLKEDDKSKIVYANNNEVVLGKWGTGYETPNGTVPLLIDANSNARTSAPGEDSHSVCVIDSWSVGGNVLMESASVPLAKTELAQSELIATFMSFCNINPSRNGVIKNIGSESGSP